MENNIISRSARIYAYARINYRKHGEVGMYQLVIADFDPKIYTTAEFWGNYLSYQTASWILTFNIINTAYKVLKKRNERYNALKNKKNF